MKSRVMVVDDEPDVVDSLKTILEKEEYEVITASDGSECIKKIEEGFQGIILLDLMMPVMDGWDTVKKIIEKNYAKDVVIEIISALGSKENKRMGKLDPYIYDYLSKPIDIKELIESVKKGNTYLYAKEKEETF